MGRGDMEEEGRVEGSGGKCRGLRAAEVFIMTVITKERI